MSVADIVGIALWTVVLVCSVWLIAFGRGCNTGVVMGLQSAKDICDDLARFEPDDEYSAGRHAGAEECKESIDDKIKGFERA